MKKTNVLVIAVLLLALVGTAAAQQGPSGELEIFHWWTVGGEAQAITEVYGIYNEMYPDVEIINATVAGGAGSEAKAVLATRMQSGDAPDSFQVHAGRELIDTWVVADKMEPVTFMFEEQGWYDVYPVDLIEILSNEGEIWSVPINVHRSNVLWYNKAIFEEHGLTPPQSWDEFFEMAETLEAADVMPMAVGDNGAWADVHLFASVLLAELGPDGYRGLWDGTTDWGGEGVTAALETFKAIFDHVNPDHAALAWNEAAQLVADGDAAMYINGDWVEGYYKSIGLEPDVEFGWAPSPGTAGSFIMLSDSFGLPKNSPNREAAVTWLELIGSIEAQDAFNPIKGSIPPRTDANRDLYDIYLISAMDDFASNELVPSLAHGAAASEGWVTAITDVMSLFVADFDVELAQMGLEQACADAGVCE